MVTTQMKTDAQRLGNGKKAFNVKQVEKMVEDAGGSYTAGDGITIEDNTISVDTASIQEKLTAGENITIENNVISATGGSDEWIEVTNIQTEKDTYFDSTTNTPKKDVIVVLNYGYAQSGTNMGSCRMYKEFYYMKGIVVPNTSCTLIGEKINDVKSNCDITVTNLNIRTLISLSDNGTGISMTHSSIRLDLTDKTITVFGQSSETISKSSGSIKVYYKA